MFVTLTEVVENTTTTNLSDTSSSRYTLREVTINPEYVVCVREDATMRRMLSEGLLPNELSTTHQFTKVYLDRGQTGIDLTVVGDPQIIEQQLLPKNKELLNG
tara:strand:- start:427 stop:735 length:309 start_codon:yes stop_codon:yes gene_type:complete